MTRSSDHPFVAASSIEMRPAPPAPVSPDEVLITCDECGEPITPERSGFMQVHKDAGKREGVAPWQAVHRGKCDRGRADFYWLDLDGTRGGFAWACTHVLRKRWATSTDLLAFIERKALP